MNRFLRKRIQTLAVVLLAFILGCTFTIGMMPIDRTCNIDNSDKEFNIMKNSKFKNPDIIILILSAPKNYEKRSIVRDTWLKLKSKLNEENTFKVKHFFVIGNLFLPKEESSKISSEQLQHSDILTLPVVDSYKNLTDKIKYSFQWLDTQYDYGLGFKYVLKCDDDSFVNLDKLVVELMKIESKYLKRIYDKNTEEYIISINYQQGGRSEDLNLYWGYFNGNARIKNKGKWKETNWIVSDRYVPYALGGGYILSKGLISYISRNMKELKSFNSEDVSVGLWLSPVNNIVRIHDIRFDTEWTSRGCKNYHLITHNVTPAEMKSFFENLVKTSKMCRQETTKRVHYMYDWNVPPSQCCKPINELKILL
ncbi:beta-1,3-galactosyltransferase 6 [Diabrotica virgifera virgifera]|uniref:Hexosyltransferase n=1 Tax=Diabrotica virgifera virgifera TaxID=50390 RepID=A0ABM5IAM7_DIAVI|nr:beta-1,3-galactosyltransferase 6 [Diabrotica virgifera virgifera]